MARRVRAAMAYGKVKREDAAKVMGTSPGTLDRIAGQKGTETKRPEWDQLWALADKANLPREWFSADLSRLREIVPAGSPVFPTPSAPNGQALPTEMAQAIEEADQLLGERPAGEPDTKPAPRRRRGGAD